MDDEADGGALEAERSPVTPQIDQIARREQAFGPEVEPIGGSGKEPARFVEHLPVSHHPHRGSSGGIDHEAEALVEFAAQCGHCGSSPLEVVGPAGPHRTPVPAGDHLARCKHLIRVVVWLLDWVVGASGGEHQRRLGVGGHVQLHHSTIVAVLDDAGRDLHPVGPHVVRPRAR